MLDTKKHFAFNSKSDTNFLKEENLYDDIYHVREITQEREALILKRATLPSIIVLIDVTHRSQKLDPFFMKKLKSFNVPIVFIGCNNADMSPFTLGVSRMNKKTIDFLLFFLLEFIRDKM
jgi:hypothetical protein